MKLPHGWWARMAYVLSVIVLVAMATLFILKLLDSIVFVPPENPEWWRDL